MDPKFRGDLIDTNSYQGCYLLTKQLLSLGHKKIFVVRGPLHLSNSFERFQGFADAMKEAGIDVMKQYPYVYTGEFTQQSGIDAVRFLQQMEERPTAILSQNNMMTIGILEELKNTQIRIPEDISLVSYDGVNNMDLMITRPTSARFDMQLLGQQVGQSILARIKDPELPSREFVFDPIIVNGNSLSIPNTP
ncbi:Ribose operon repressor [bioreactor metagenome]|uniref:Ribose operon repressor n=1 Tax=bioreactor metagenome TaxID=1076179 RepID=A0A645CIW5_9ZZZZ